MPSHASPPGLLLLSALAAIALLLFLILYAKVHAFFALLFSSLILALMSGMPPHSIVLSFQKGMGDLLGSVAVIIAAGAVVGRLIEVTRAGEVIAHRLIALLGSARVPWAVLAFGYLIGIPVFYDVAFMTFVPLAWNLSKLAKRSLLFYVLPLIAALMTTTALVPTNPGPAAAAQLLGAEIGKVMLCGLVLGLPMAVVGGIVYGRWIGSRIYIEAPEHLMPKVATTHESVIRVPSLVNIVSVILLPVMLMAMGVLLPSWLPADSKLTVWAKFVGHPIVALISTTALSFLVLGVRLGISPATLMRHTTQALNSVGSLILIIGASGAFRQIVVDSGSGDSLVRLVLSTRFSPLVMAYLVAAVLRIALGSATASIATAAGLVAPIAQSFPNVNVVLIVMAVAVGGSVFSYVNDAGFWMVKEYCGLSVAQTIKSYSVMKLIASLTGLLLLWILSHFM